MAEAQSAPAPALAVVAVSLAADHGAARAVALLEDAGIPVLLLKGASLAEWLYDGADIRGYSDADLLVDPDDHASAEVILAGAGYTKLVRHMHASVWQTPGDPIVVDLHWRLWAFDSSPRVVWRALWARSVTQSIGGRDIRVLDKSARGLVVVLHQAHHHELEQDTVRTGHDLTRALALLSDHDWDVVADLAQELRATLRLANGLRSLDDPRADAVADRLNLPDASVLATVIKPDETVALMGAIVNFRAARGPRRKLKVLRQEIAPPADELRERSALARRGPAGLAVAYVLAPLWSLGKLPAALSHLRGVAARGR